MPGVCQVFVAQQTIRQSSQPYYLKNGGLLMEQEAMIGVGTLTFSDIKEYGFHFYKKIVVGYFIFVFFLFLLLFLPIHSLTWQGALIDLLIAAAATLLLASLLFYKIKREFASNHILKQEIAYDVKPDGITQRRGESRVVYRWNDFRRAYEYKHMFRLSISRAQSVIVPKRFFKQEADVRRFRALIAGAMMSRKVSVRDDARR
jgi:hypothetical protein